MRSIQFTSCCTLPVPTYRQFRFHPCCEFLVADFVRVADVLCLVFPACKLQDNRIHDNVKASQLTCILVLDVAVTGIRELNPLSHAILLLRAPELYLHLLVDVLCRMIDALSISSMTHSAHLPSPVALQRAYKAIPACTSCFRFISRCSFSSLHGCRDLVVSAVCQNLHSALRTDPLPPDGYLLGGSSAAVRLCRHRRVDVCFLGQS